MSNLLIQSDTLSDIADAIRSKTGNADLMTPLEMPDEISSIITGGLPTMTGWEITEPEVTLFEHKYITGSYTSPTVATDTSIDTGCVRIDMGASTSSFLMILVLADTTLGRSRWGCSNTYSPTTLSQLTLLPFDQYTSKKYAFAFNTNNISNRYAFFYGNWGSNLAWFNTHCKFLLFRLVS